MIERKREKESKKEGGKWRRERDGVDGGKKKKKKRNKKKGELLAILQQQQQNLVCHRCIHRLFLEKRTCDHLPCSPRFFQRSLMYFQCVKTHSL